MKLEIFLRGLLAGVALTGAVAWFALYGNNCQWERDAYEHYAGIYTLTKEHKVEWMWFDDYARRVLLPKAKENLHGTPSPIPKEGWMDL